MTSWEEPASQDQINYILHLAKKLGYQPNEHDYKFLPQNSLDAMRLIEELERELRWRKWREWRESRLKPELAVEEAEKIIREGGKGRA